MSFFPKTRTTKKNVSKGSFRVGTVRRKVNSFDSIKRERKLKNSKLRSYSLVRSLNKSYILIFMFILILSLVGFALSSVKFYPIQNIEIYGNERVSSELLENYFSNIRGEDLLSISKNDIVGGLKDVALEIDNVNFVKILPDTLVIEVIESSPSLVFFNLNSVDLLSFNGNKVGGLDVEGVSLSDFELSILRGEGNPDASYVRDYLQSRAEGVFVWDSIDSEERLSVVRLFQSQVADRISRYISDILERIEASSYNDLLVVYSYQSDFALNSNAIVFLTDISSFLEEKGIPIDVVNAINGFDYEFHLGGQKVIIFSMRRSADEQLDDLETILLNDILSQGKIFDLRTRNYSVK